MNLSNAGKVMKVILITGSTDGIGLEAARKLLQEGHKVLLHGRNPQKLQSVAQELGVIDDTFLADLSDLIQVLKLSQDIQKRHNRLDVLLNNAGVLQTSNPETPQGLDARFAVNTIAPYILSKELMSIIPEKNGRIINIASAGQAPVSLGEGFKFKKNSSSNNNNNNDDDFAVYTQSKLAMIMWSNALAAAEEQQKREGRQRVICSVNPASLIGTKMVIEGFGKASVRNDIHVGADILVQAAVSPDFANANGQYFDNDLRRFGSPHPDALHPEKCQQVVQAIEKVVKATDNIIRKSK